MISEAQRERRKKYLGSSDAPSIVGVNPWGSAADVYWEKIGATEDNEIDSEAALIGTLCEDAVLKWFSKETGKKIIRNQSRVHENKIMAANFDALVTGVDEAVEAKTTGIISQIDKSEWGEPETDAVPERVIIQCQHQMAVLPVLKRVWVPVLLGGIGFRLYCIDRNDDLIKCIETIETDFWRKYVETKTPPPDNLPTINTIKSIRRIPEKIASLDDALVRNWIEAKIMASEAEKSKQLAQSAVLSALGDAEVGDCSFGRLTYFQQNMKERVSPACSFRVARFKENRI